jgi:hypothetical protein
MRRVGFLIISLCAVLLTGAAPAAAADPTPAATASGAPGETVCTIADPRLIELSGVVALPDGGYVVVNDSNDQAAAMRIFFLDSKCKPTRPVGYPAAARDPEDLAVSGDGALWAADIGDNFTNGAKDRRETIALWKVPAGGGAPVIHRLTYPDGPHDAEALLFGPNDTPIIVTKEPSGTAQLYEASAPLQPNTKAGVPLKNVGTFKPTRTGTANPLAGPGNLLVTGAATAPDRKRVVLRTYSDAYEWDVPDGDVVKAITAGKPRITPLPGEPQGEGIAYTPDGKSFITCSDQSGPTRLLRYQPAAAAAAATPGKGAGKAVKAADTRPWYKKLSLPEIINVVGGVGLLGLLLVIIGVVGISRSRNKRRNAAKAPVSPADPPGTAGDGAGAVSAEDERPTAYMSAVAADAPPPANPGPAPSGSVYGGGAANRPSGAAGAQPAQGGGAVYGGGVYGSGYAQPDQGQPGYDRDAGRQQFSQPGYHSGDDQRYHGRA